MKFVNLERQSKKILSKNIKSLRKILSSSQFIMGDDVLKLENKLKKFTKSKYCITTSSGTDALLIALMSLNLKKGAEIITTPFTYVATSEIILRLGFKPVYVDIDCDTCNILPSEIEKKISKKTGAIIPVSLFGQTANFKKIVNIGKLYKIPIIEDAAQSFGAKHFGSRSCNLSDIGCTSFFPTKSLGAYGDGGAIFTNKKKIAEKCQIIRSHGQIKKYDYKILGVNGRLDTIQASFLLNKLDIFEEELKRRKLKARYYMNKLNIKEIKFLKTDKGNSNIHTLFNILVKNRNKLAIFLKQKKIPTMIYYPKPLNFYGPFKKYKENFKNLKNSYKVCEEILSLPFSPYITRSEQDKVIKYIKLFYKK